MCFMCPVHFPSHGGISEKRMNENGRAVRALRLSAIRHVSLLMRVDDRGSAELSATDGGKEYRAVDFKKDGMRAAAHCFCAAKV